MCLFVTFCFAKCFKIFYSQACFLTFKIIICISDRVRYILLMIIIKHWYQIGTRYRQEPKAQVLLSVSGRKKSDRCILICVQQI